MTKSIKFVELNKVHQTQQGAPNSTKYTKLNKVHQTQQSTPNSNKSTKLNKVHQTQQSTPNSTKYTKVDKVCQTLQSVLVSTKLDQKLPKVIEIFISSVLILCWRASVKFELRVIQDSTSGHVTRWETYHIR